MTKIIIKNKIKKINSHKFSNRKIIGGNNDLIEKIYLYSKNKKLDDNLYIENNNITQIDDIFNININKKGILKINLNYDFLTIEKKDLDNLKFPEFNNNQESLYEKFKKEKNNKLNQTENNSRNNSNSNLGNKQQDSGLNSNLNMFDSFINDKLNVIIFKYDDQNIPYIKCNNNWFFIIKKILYKCDQDIKLNQIIHDNMNDKIYPEYFLYNNDQIKINLLHNSYPQNCPRIINNIHNYLFFHNNDLVEKAITESKIENNNIDNEKKLEKYLYFIENIYFNKTSDNDIKINSPKQLNINELINNYRVNSNNKSIFDEYCFFIEEKIDDTYEYEKKLFYNHNYDNKQLIKSDKILSFNDNIDNYNKQEEINIKNKKLYIYNNNSNISGGFNNRKFICQSNKISKINQHYLNDYEIYDTSNNSNYGRINNLQFGGAEEKIETYYGIFRKLQGNTELEIENKNINNAVFSPKIYTNKIITLLKNKNENKNIETTNKWLNIFTNKYKITNKIKGMYKYKITNKIKGMFSGFKIPNFTLFSKNNPQITEEQKEIAAEDPQIKKTIKDLDSSMNKPQKEQKELFQKLKNEITRFSNFSKREKILNKKDINNEIFSILNNTTRELVKKKLKLEETDNIENVLKKISNLAIIKNLNENLYILLNDLNKNGKYKNIKYKNYNLYIQINDKYYFNQYIFDKMINGRLNKKMKKSSYNSLLTSKNKILNK